MNDTQNDSVNSIHEPQKSKKKLIIIGVVVVLVLLGIQSMLSPERLAEKAFESATGEVIDIEDGGATYKLTDEDGATLEISTEDQATLPKGWPDDVPVYGGATITYAGVATDQSGKKNFTVSLTTGDSAEKVAEFYNDALSKNGWEIQSALTTTEGAMVASTRGENGAMVYITKGPETAIAITVGMMD